MKKCIKSILIVLGIIIGIILIDTLQAKVFNNSPLIKVRENYNGGSTFYIDKGILVNHYYCSDKEEKTLFKGTKFSCAVSRSDLGEVKEIVDTTKDIKDFACNEALEEFYVDENYMYYWNCIKNEYMIVKYENGFEETISNALKYRTITISDLDKFGIGYIKEEKID